MVRILFLFSLLILFRTASGQDIIVRTNNDSIKAKVIEITIDKIKFQYASMQGGPILEIAKNLVKEIIYSNGSRLTIVFNPYEVSKDLYIQERSHAIKADIVAPFLNHFTFAYEMKLKTGRNIEVKVGIIKPFVWQDLGYAEGFFVKAGLKFVKLTDSYLKGLKYIHPLKGSYLKPEIIFGSFWRNEDDNKIYYTNIGLNLLFGKQAILWNFMTFDVCGGLGLGLQNYKYEDPSIDHEDVDFNYAYSHIFLGKKLPIIISGAMTIGVVF